MKIFIDLKDAVLDLSLSDRLELSTLLLSSIYDYSEMYLCDGDDDQYRRLLAVKNNLEYSLNALSRIDPNNLDLGN